MTAASIPASSGGDYAGYLDGKTVAPERGDYYLGPDGMPAEAPGRWIGDADALARVGATPGVVDAHELRSLMAGQRPDDPDTFLRAAGPDGTRGAGIDVTFSAPKSVSIAWALAGAEQRTAIEAAHRAAVERSVGYLRDTTELTTRWDPAGRASVPDRAAHLHAAEFLHTTARGVGDGAPDPQLHSHVVITSVERPDGRIAAVRSRPVLRSAREVGAYYAPSSQPSCANRATRSRRPARTAATSASPASPPTSSRRSPNAPPKSSARRERSGPSTAASPSAASCAPSRSAPAPRRLRTPGPSSKRAGRPPPPRTASTTRPSPS